jgi:hypothetical protein
MKIRQLDAGVRSTVSLPIQAYAFQSSPPGEELRGRLEYNQQYYAGNVTLVAEEGGVAMADASAFPMRQNVRGTVYRMAGVAGVATLPLARRRGYARFGTGVAGADAGVRARAERAVPVPPVVLPAFRVYRAAPDTDGQLGLCSPSRSLLEVSYGRLQSPSWPVRKRMAIISGQTPRGASHQQVAGAERVRGDAPGAPPGSTRPCPNGPRSVRPRRRRRLRFLRDARHRRHRRRAGHTANRRPVPARAFARHPVGRRCHLR